MKSVILSKTVELYLFLTLLLSACFILFTYETFYDVFNAVCTSLLVLLLTTYTKAIVNIKETNKNRPVFMFVAGSCLLWTLSLVRRFPTYHTTNYFNELIPLLILYPAIFLQLYPMEIIRGDNRTITTLGLILGSVIALVMFKLGRT